MEEVSMAKTYAEINEKIKKGQAVVVTAEEVIDIAEKKGIKRAAQEIDVVTTGTFGPMCSSGAFINLGHSKPRIKIQKAWLNGVNAYAGLAAVDVYLGVTEIPDDDPANKIYPGEFKYGGAHVIEELVAGKDVRLKAISYGTDCYPRKEIETWINLKDLNQAYLCNPRNAYQNYNVAVNSSDRVLYTYLGNLLPKFGNANYCSAGQLSPLLNDPFYKTIGIGTRIFLGGGTGYVYWEGTQHTPTAKRNEKGIPKTPAGTLAVLGDLKQMNPKWLKAVSFTGYGVTLSIGIGVPIPILNEEILEYTAIKDEDIFAPIVDYATAYPDRKPDTLGEVNYKDLRSGTIKFNGKDVPTGGLSSYSKAREIALILKQWIQDGKFLITEPVQHLAGPDSGQTFKPLNDRP
jgi:uncharacterized protein (DUF39 family)